MIDYLFFIIAALLIFLTFRLLRLIDYRIKRLRKYYPLFVATELGLWIFYIFWVVSHFLYTKSYYNELVLVLVVAVVILLVWYYIKDIVAGFVFKIRHNPRPDQILHSPEGEGVIRKLSSSQVLVEAGGRNILRIPYSKLLGKGLSLETADTHSACEAILFFEMEQGKEPTELKRKIRMDLLQSPWCVPSRPIRIEFLSEPKYGIEVTLYLLDKTYTEIVKEKMKALLG